MVGTVIDVGPDLGSPDSGPALSGKPVAGLTLLERAALTARAVGAGPLVVVTADGEPVSGAGRRFPKDARWVSPQDLPAALRATSDTERWLFFPVRVITDMACIRAVTGAAEAAPARMQADRAPGAPPTSLWAADTETFIRTLRDPELQSEQRRSSSFREVEIPASAVCYVICGKTDLPKAERRLLASQGSDTDGWVDRVFNRHLSRAFSRVALRTSITPNQVTVLHILLGLLGALCFTRPTYVWGSPRCRPVPALGGDRLLGRRIARLKLQFSKFGGTLDVVGDNVVHAAAFVAIGIAARRQFGHRSGDGARRERDGGHLSRLCRRRAAHGVAAAALGGREARRVRPGPSCSQPLAHRTNKCRRPARPGAARCRDQ